MIKLRFVERKKGGNMSIVTMKELLEAGAHFGHQSARWEPKMGKYIYSSRNGIHVIDLHKSIPLIEKAYAFIKDQITQSGTILFVGTKKQAQEAVETQAKRCGMFYIKDRWLGGTLTNFKTLQKNISRMKEIEKMEADELFEKLPKKEVATLRREHRKLVRGLDGIRDMKKPPSVVFIIDTKKEQTALAEARKLKIPIVAIVDTNCDPDQVDFPIPGNDDAIRSIKLLTSIIADAILAGRELLKPEEERAPEIAVPLEVGAEELKSEEAKGEEKTEEKKEEKAEEMSEDAKIVTEEERLEDLAPKLPQNEEEKERIGF